MADGEMTLKLDAASLSALDAEAKAIGLAPDDYARLLLQDALGIGDRWAISEARLEEYDRTGEAIPIEEAFDMLRKMVAERRARRK
jgi:hypothetical protein